MAKNDGGLRQISVQGGSVTVTLGGIEATVPGGQLESFIKALEAARLMLAVQVGEAPARAVSTRAYTTYEPRPEVAAEPAPPKRRGGRPKGSTNNNAARRSRKRVGDALADWLRDNPGWHSTEDLLAVVSNNRMTDASPKRALMIALGKQRDSVFISDGAGNWKLAGDPSPAKASAPKERKKPGRKPGSTTKAKGKARAKAKAKTTRSTRAKRETKGGRGKKADSEGSPVDVPQEIQPGRLVRVKRGQDRREALLTPAELEARKQAATAVDSLQFRWDVASRAERERMRRNLFGDAVGKMN